MRCTSLLGPDRLTPADATKATSSNLCELASTRSSAEPDGVSDTARRVICARAYGRSDEQSPLTRAALGSGHGRLGLAVAARTQQWPRRPTQALSEECADPHHHSTTY